MSTLDDDIKDAWDAMKGHRRARPDEVCCSHAGCGGEAAPGTDVCRNHGALLPAVQAAAMIRLEAARLRIADTLSEAAEEAVAYYLNVLRGYDLGAKTRDRLTAADRIVALAGGAASLALGEGETLEESGPVLILRQMLAAAPDDRLERLARRIGAIPASSSEVELL